jgi:gluconolactonase
MDQLASGYGLIEGPVWDPARGLLFSDVINGGVFCLERGGEVRPVIEHRRGIGGMALHEGGGLVVSGRNVAVKPAGGGATRVLLEADAERGELGFNDLATDAAGRVYVGSLGFHPLAPDDAPKPGKLLCIDLDGSARVVADDVLLTNGLALSPDGRRLYHSESLRHVVRVYEVGDGGALSPHRAFAEVEGGIPDGLAVAEDGSVWVAIAFGGRVDVFEPGGRLRASLPVEIPMVTSLCFGGPERRDLYIVTGSQGADRDDLGFVFRTPVEVAGLALAPARVALG